MSQPAGPPAYDAIYSQGMPIQPVQVQPQPQVAPQVVYVVESQTRVVHGAGGYHGGMGDAPTVVFCASCNQMIRTTTVMTPAARTHCCALLLCLCGCWPCCPVPYCIPSCNNVDHFCPNCNAYVGSYTG